MRLISIFIVAFVPFIVPKLVIAQAFATTQPFQSVVPVVSYQPVTVTPVMVYRPTLLPSIFGPYRAFPAYIVKPYGCPTPPTSGQSSSTAAQPYSVR